MSERNALIEAYTQKIDYWLPYSKERKGQVLKRLKSDVNEAIHDTGVDDPVIAFGDPYQVAKNLSLSQDWATHRASYIQRAFAYLIDALTQITGVLVGFGIWFQIIFGEIPTGSSDLSAKQVNLALVTLFIFVVPYVLFWVYGYFVLLEKATNTTIGKAIFGLSVCDESGIRIKWSQAFIRNITKFQVMLLLIEVLLGLVQKTNHQRPLDVVAKTIVVRRK